VTKSGAVATGPARPPESRKTGKPGKQLVPAAAARFEVVQVREPPGFVRRVATTGRHLAGLGLGGLVAFVRSRREAGNGRGLRFVPLRVAAFFARPFVRHDLRGQAFPVQLRRRLELLGPTYIKLGQILSLREDLLPKDVTAELRNLLDRLPVIPFPDFIAAVEKDLRRPADEMFLWMDPTPYGSASIAQAHRATTQHGDAVILKVVKPGVRETLRRDVRLLKILGGMLQVVLPRYQPRRIIAEFCHYTLREADLKLEADNIETFAANFADDPNVVFPEVFREYSGQSVLCMEFLEGLRPDSPEAQELSDEDKQRLIDCGAGAIIRMLYRDGFFHADLHPANLIIVLGEKGEPPRAGFIDLGMVGRLDDELRRTLLYYYYSLVMGDAENSARYLASVAVAGPDGDPVGFRRDVREISSRWRRAASFEGFSLAQLVLESVAQGARHGMYFPVEMVLMVKALVTYEGAGHLLMPGFDVAEVSRRHIRAVFVQQFSPIRLVQEALRGAPDLVDAMVKLPLLVTEGLRVLEKTTHHKRENPLAGVRGTVLAGFCIVAASVLLGTGAAWPLWAGLFALAALLAFRRGG
jgi:ubiquinone biosynthesis protein